ncbi:hemocyte protein-glutamine gamma-glutamyltransferase-like [Ixodes scapularis]
MTSESLKPLLDFACGTVHTQDDLDKMTLVMNFLRKQNTIIGHSTGHLSIDSVNLFEKENARDNNTGQYKIVHGEFPSCVLRRGNLFQVGIRFNQPIEHSELDLKIILSLGKNPTTEDGTLVFLDAPKVVEENSDTHKNPNEWSISINFHHKDMMLLKMRSPAQTPVGRWTLGLKTGDEDVHVVDRHIYIIFNAWLPEDPVYMENEEEREFYIVKDSSVYFYGTHKNWAKKKWYYGQVNMQDDQGVMLGRWTTPFSGGTSPSAWNSTLPILNKYMESGGNAVKYAQCFVFGAVLTTLLRALGIPSRTVTNFGSAHDDDGDMAVDYYYDENEKHIPGGDQEWNFHVWTECWMARPDLAEGFGGWQVVDGTPQVLSDGKYQVGPYPVKAIQQDKTDLKYDGKYVTAEVKADYKYHKKDSKEPSGWKLLAVQKDMAGRLILTEKLDLHGETHEAEDITHTYKNKRSLARGRTMSVVELTFNHSKTVTAGDTIHVVYKVINNDLDARDVSVNVDASAVTYNNRDPAMLASTSRKFNLPAGADESFELNIDAEAYVGKLHLEGIVLFNAVASFEGGIFNTRDTVTVEMPPLKLEVLAREEPMGELTYRLSLKNPLQVALTDCELTVELPASTRFLETTAVGDVPAGGTFEKTGILFVTTPDTKHIVATFMSSQLPVVTGVKEF